MYVARPQAAPPPALLLTERDEQIIRTIATYRVMNAEQIARLLFSPSSLTYVRARLARLAGRRDFAPRSYLCRFPQPTSTPGAKPKVYRLGVFGRQLLAREGLPVSGSYRPSKQYSYSHLQHALTLTSVVICAHQTPGYTLTDLQLSYDIARNAPTVEMPAPEDEEPVTVAVIPDVFAMFSRQRDGQLFPTCIEVDRATIPHGRIKEALRARLLLFSSGAYTRWCGRRSVRFLYLTDAETKESSDARRRALCRLMAEVLAEEERESWADLFRAASLKDCADLYEPPLFAAPVWYMPGNAKSEPLLTP